MAERMIETNDIELCTEPFGDPAHPRILLIMGQGGSMIWWEDDFCRMLADGGRFVIRYDNRDTGRSVTYEPGRPGYTFADLVGDAAGILDAYGIPAAHVVGISMGGAIAQLLALDFADRVSSLVLMMTSPAGPGNDGLPPMTEEYARFLARPEADWSHTQAQIEYTVENFRAASGRRPFDEAHVRELIVRDGERARNIASLQNHGVLSGGEAWRHRLPLLNVPTLVIQGSADPLFQPGHGEALANEIPGARLLTLDGAGHGLHRADWDTVVQAILEHTSLV